MLFQCSALQNEAPQETKSDLESSESIQCTPFFCNVIPLTFIEVYWGFTINIFSLCLPFSNSKKHKFWVQRHSSAASRGGQRGGKNWFRRWKRRGGGGGPYCSSSTGNSSELRYSQPWHRLPSHDQHWCMSHTTNIRSAFLIKHLIHFLELPNDHSMREREREATKFLGLFFKI